MRPPILARTGAVLLAVFLFAYHPPCGLWCHYIEVPATPELKLKGAFTNGFHALDVMIKLAAMSATVLAVCSIASLLRREQRARLSLIYGVPASIISLAVIGLFQRTGTGGRPASLFCA